VREGKKLEGKGKGEEKGEKITVVMPGMTVQKVVTTR